MATHCSHSILYIDFTVSRPPQAATRQALRNVFVEWISPLLTPFYVCAVLDGFWGSFWCHVLVVYTSLNGCACR